MEPRARTRIEADKQKDTRSLYIGNPTIMKNSPGQVPSRRALGPIILAFLLGVVFTVVIALLSFLLLSPNRSVSTVFQQPVNGAITVQISREYLRQVVQKELKTSGLPGSISNAQLAFGQNNLVTVSGDDRVSILGLGVTKHFTILMQLSVSSCQLHAHIVHADLEGIPVTGFVATFENQINQQLQTQQSGLPTGFIYCASGVQIQTNTVEVMYSAVPSQ